MIGPFFAGLAEQEQYHADLLEVCRAAAARKGWKSQLFNPWDDYLPRLEQQMDAAYADVWKIDSVEAALQLVVEIESAEINQVFRTALAATDSAFVKKLRPFKEAMECAHDLHRGPSAGVVAQHDASLPGVAGEVSRGAKAGLKARSILVLSWRGGCCGQSSRSLRPRGDATL